MPAPEAPATGSSRPSRWAALLARIYETFPLICPSCGTALTFIAFLTHPGPITQILAHIGEPTSPPLLHPARGPPQTELPSLRSGEPAGYQIALPGHFGPARVRPRRPRRGRDRPGFRPGQPRSDAEVQSRRSRARSRTRARPEPGLVSPEFQTGLAGGAPLRAPDSLLSNPIPSDTPSCSKTRTSSHAASR